jgi:hypothetical protein
MQMSYGKEHTTNSSRSTEEKRSLLANVKPHSTSSSSPLPVLTDELTGSMLNDKKGPIGKLLRGISANNRELWFIFFQLSQSLQEDQDVQADKQSTALYS